VSTGGPEAGPDGLSRRDALSMIAGVAGVGLGRVNDPGAGSGPRAPRAQRRFRVRALTAGVPLGDFRETGAVEAALDFLIEARQRCIAAGYEVQTIRVALNPLLMDVVAVARMDAVPALGVLDRLVGERGAVLSIGPVFGTGGADDSLASWAARLVQATNATSFSVAVASPSHGVHTAAVQMAADVIAALATATPGGTANFRLAAAACVPPGTPFFPVGYHDGPPSLAIGLETANLVADAFVGVQSFGEGTERLRAALNAELRPVEQLGRAIAADGHRRYLGIDSSPAPGTDSSIGRALEILSGQKFGAASTLQACAAVTAAIRSLDVETCGYCGLMLPILEDPVLAQRAAEARVTLAQLLLYSSVCGTGLDVVPLPGAATPAALARVVGDVATLAARLKKPLSARLFPVPGKLAGDAVELPDPRLCPSRVIALEP
jgi:uncharacterized protein (UPF0210 family)